MPAGPRGRRRADGRASGLPSAPWWIGGSAAAVVGVVGVVVLTQSMGPAACAASGKATFYTLGSFGNCSLPDPGNGLFVALPPGEYAAAAGCGSYLSVTGPKGTVRVKVIDQCPECEAGHIDLSAAAFAKIADPVQGIVNVTYSTVRNPSVGNLTVRVKEGSSQWWLALLVDNTGNATKSVQVRSGGGSWKSTNRADYNYWIADSGAGTGPFDVRVTDVAGHQATVTGIRLSPGTVQATGVSMYSGKAVAVTTAKRTTTTTRKPVTTTRRAATSTSSTTVVTVAGTPTTSAATTPMTATTAAPSEPAAPVPAGGSPRVAEAASSGC